MSKRNPEYDFVWCPGCGDFGVRRALEFALAEYTIENDKQIIHKYITHIYLHVQEICS